MDLIIISGGQTGVDRAALDVGLESGLECAGWCPRGRVAEDGPIDPRYPLTETLSDEYEERTLWNARDSDATLVIQRGEIMGETKLTVTTCQQLGKPHLVVNPEDPKAAAKAAHWIVTHEMRVLNVAGPRESGQTGVYVQARDLLREILTELNDSGGGGTDF